PQFDPVSLHDALPICYTILFAVNSMAIFPYTRSSANPLPFDPNGFTPIGSVAESAHVIVANKSLGIKTVADLVEAAKKKPDSLRDRKSTRLNSSPGKI